MRKPVVALALLVAVSATSALAGPRPTGEERLQKLLQGRTAGKPANCIPLRPSMPSTKIERTGVVYGSGRRIYVNRFENGCPISSFDVMVTRTSIGQLCQGDIVRLIDPTARIERGSCVLGQFIPYDKAR